MNDQPAMALLGTGSNIVSVHAPNGPDSFPDVRVYIPPSNAKPVTIFAEMPYQWPPKWESEKVTFDQDFEASRK